MNITLAPEHGYVALAICATSIVNTFLAMRVMKARKQYGVKYPVRPPLQFADTMTRHES